MKTVKIILKIIFVASLTIAAITYFLKNTLPDESTIVDSLYLDPIQSILDEPVIEKSEGGIDYTIEPLYSFEEWGLVVSVNDNEKWYSRFKDTDPLNTKDICLIWGENIEGEHYKEANYKSEEFVCFYYPTTKEASESFSGLHLANNHLLPKNDRIHKEIKNAKVGDQIHFSGYLSSYAAKQTDGQEWSRGTSTTRDDTGNGACETVYVTDFEILVVGNPLASSLFNSSIILTILTFIVLFILMFIPETRNSTPEIVTPLTPRPPTPGTPNNMGLNKQKASVVKDYEAKKEKVDINDLLPPKKDE